MDDQFRASVVVVAVAFITLFVSACSDVDMALPVTVVNLTTGAMDVTLHETSSDGVDDPTTTMAILPGARQEFDGQLVNSCMTGNLVATREGRTVATIQKPCAGSRWGITEEGASQMP